MRGSSERDTDDGLALSERGGTAGLGSSTDNEAAMTGVGAAGRPSSGGTLRGVAGRTGSATGTGASSASANAAAVGNR
ncbi:MAG: hypothetical protein GQE15_29200, partial [Archangiaceae bacterium]|nr:hypothetical protein [Archangiaceae bacterium]